MDILPLPWAFYTAKTHANTVVRASAYDEAETAFALAASVLADCAPPPAR
jgi:hypothetical protein